MAKFKVGELAAVPMALLFPDRTGARSRYGYDIGVVTATGRNKKTGKPAIKVRIPVSESVWAKKQTNEAELEKWFFAADCDKM